MPEMSPDQRHAVDIPLIALVGVFVTALISTQLLAVKILELALPATLPAVGGAIIVPAGVLAYAVTFLATDCIAELYGRRTAHVVVNVGFVMILFLLGLVWLAILAPGSPQGVDPSAFSAVMGPSTNVVLGGLVAYVISQNWDVFVFHRIRAWTGRRWLWVRNVGSTATSQAIDTVVFIAIAFWLAPIALGIGQPVPGDVLVGLVLGQYLAKLLIALLDTPLVYAVVGLVRSGRAPTATALAD